MALKIVWTPKAVSGLDSVLIYLEKEWTRREILNLETRLSALLKQISLQPQLFPRTSEVRNIRKALVDKNNYIIYRWEPDGEVIEIINFRGTKQKPT